MQGVNPFLSFKDQAEEALNLYVSVIPNSRITSMMKSESDGPIAKGKVLHATFELDGREFAAMDGGDTFSFSEGFSLFLTCDTQEEIDQVWTRLTENGGRPGGSAANDQVRTFLRRPRRDGVGALDDQGWHRVVVGSRGLFHRGDGD